LTKRHWKIINNVSLLEIYVRKMLKRFYGKDNMSEKDKMNLHKKSLWGKICVFLSVIAIFTCPSLFSQEPDPFYQKLLLQGEQSFLNKNYPQAIKELDIAVFGLYGKSPLIVKAHIYLGISYFHLKNGEESEKYLKKAYEILGETGIKSLDIHDSVREELEKLLVRFKIKEPREELQGKPAEESEKKSTEATKTKPKKKSSKDLIKELEKKIKNNPRKVSLYYELYDIYRKDNKFKNAKNIIKKLVKNNPQDMNGNFLLGKIEFIQKHYKDALRCFMRILKPSDRTDVTRELYLKTMLNTASCYYRLKDRERLESYISYLRDFVSEEELNLTLKQEGMEKEWNNILKFIKEIP